MNLSIGLSKAEHIQGLEAYIERRLCFSLRRFATHVRIVVVHIVGSEGFYGIAQVCRISVDAWTGGRVTVEESNPDLHVAIDRAARKIKRSFARELKRAQQIGKRMRPNLAA